MADLSNALYIYIEMIMGFDLYFLLIDFCILNQLAFPRIRDGCVFKQPCIFHLEKCRNLFCQHYHGSNRNETERT